MSRPLLAGITALGLVAACNVAQAEPLIYLGYSDTATGPITTLLSASWNPGPAVYGYSSNGTGTITGSANNGSGTVPLPTTGPSTNGFYINTFSAFGNFNPYTFQSNNLSVQHVGSASTIYLWATLTDIPLSSFTSTIFSGLTENQLSSGWSVTQNTYYNATPDSSNPYAYTQQLAGYTFQNYGGTASVSYNTPVSQLPTSGLFSVTAEYIINSPNNSSYQSANSTISLHAVPEPSDLGMMGLGLMMIGLLGLKLRQKKYRSESLEA